MGFSMLGSLGSHVFVGNSHGKNVKLQFFGEVGKRTAISFKHCSKYGSFSRPVFGSKFESFQFEERTSPAEVKKEIERCYELISRLGRGVVYLGSSRIGPGHSQYLQSLELGREIATILDCTSWSGAGPGLMDAVTKGALEAGKPVGGFKIGKEAGEWTASNFHPYLPSEVYLTCRHVNSAELLESLQTKVLGESKLLLLLNYQTVMVAFFSARKHGLVDAAVRSTSTDRTAVVALPGGIGTLDEMFEILALIQLERIGSELPVPFLLMNYDSFYSKLLEFLDDCKVHSTVNEGEVESLWKVCDNNSEALAYLADFYGLRLGDKDKHGTGLRSAHGTIS